MTTTPTGGPEAVRNLNQAVKRHRGDTEAWIRLGELLRARRTMLGYPDGRRQRFVHDRCHPDDPDGLTYKFVYELESGPRWGRSGFPAGRLITAAAAYDVTLESIVAALDGGELEPVTPGPALAVAPAAPRLVPAALVSADPPSAVRMGLRMSGFLDEDAVIAAAAPHATAILLRLRDLAAEGNMSPAGEHVFTGSDDSSRLAAHRWDKGAENMPDYDVRAWYVATKAVTETAGPQADMNVG